MTIDGYYVPEELLTNVQRRADATRERQFIGLFYTGFNQHGTVPTEWNRYRRDAAVGRHCSWEYGTPYDELKQMPNLAAILWVSPTREAEA